MIDSATLNFDKLDGLIPVVIQDYLSAEVLMLGFMNHEALNITQKTGLVTFFSRSRQTLWQKGESSGHFLQVKTIAQDCDDDSLLILAERIGPTCHTGANSCFKTTIQPSAITIATLFERIAMRARSDSQDSYTVQLLQQGCSKIAQKIGEEGVEVALAAVNETDEALLGEITDLFYHVFVLLQAKNLNLIDLANIIHARAK